ncbi:leucine-rich repeat domain-containing protein [Prevotella sp. F0091]|uniref:leucine-rich repeat domain-containing protein n=2 Tax=Prevotella TaxID=838 RepID=UPI0003F92AED|nr:leucine-rich repeat domain-containing protein [Prevotella sp. F0091]
MVKIKLLLLALLFAAIPNFLWAYTKDKVVTFEGLSYKVLEEDGPDKDPKLMFVGTTKTGHVEIPAIVKDGKGITFKVTEIGQETDYNCKNVTSVKMPESIVKINDGSFAESTITRIDIPKNVAEIETNAWIRLSKNPECHVALENPNFESDQNGVLYTKGKTELRTVPSNIMSKVGGDTYTVNTTVTYITKAAFRDSENLKKIKLPTTLEKVDDFWPTIASTRTLEAFVMDGVGTKYQVVDGVLFTKGPNGPNRLIRYPHAKDQAKYTVPAGVAEIAGNGFSGTPSLTDINLNEVTKVEVSAIANLPNLKKITLPKNLRKDGLVKGAFENCPKLEAYDVAPGNPDFSAEDGVLFSADKKTLYFYPIGKQDRSYTIPNTVEEIADKAFQGAKWITSLVIPTNVKRIKGEAFRQNYNLSSVEFKEPSNLTELGNYAFWTCPKLKEVTLPSSIDKIGKSFVNCDILETINVPNGSKIETIEADAFKTNKNLKNFNFKGTCLLKTIKANAFQDLENFETFNFPKTVTNIERNAFTGCKNMKTVKFDENADIEKIGEGAFADCGLTTISLPEKVKEIEKEAFLKCKALEVINIKKYTTRIDPEAFKYCDNLTDINIDKENTVYSSIDGYLLSPDKKTLILFPPGKANSKFTLLPPSIEKIGDNSFLNCEKLTNVTIPNKVKEIGRRAFGLCKNLNTITFLCDEMINPNMINQAENNMSFDDGTQADDMFKNITINVRKELYDRYNSTPFYKKFKGIKKSFEVDREEYIAMSEKSVNMLKTKREDHTFVLPTEIEHEGKKYEVNLIGDYAFEGVNNKIKEVVVKKNVEYIGAKAFVTNKDKNNLQSTVESVFFIESEPTAKMLSTTRFELDETKENYNEFAPTTKVYVKKTALPKYTEKWDKKVYDRDIHKFKESEFNFISQIDYKIPAKNFITNKYGTFAREFDTDFSAYKAEKNNTDIAAFVSKRTDIKIGKGDYGISTYHVGMTSVDVNGGVRGNYGYVPAETGVLLKVLDKEATPDDFFYTIGEKDDVKYTITGNIMRGITVNSRSVSPTEDGGPVYVITKKKGIFEKLTRTVELFPIHKAYALIGSVPAGAKVMFSFSDEDSSTTGIMSVDAEKPADNVYYNLNGQRVTTPQRGIFIQNGRKVIVK